MGSWVAQDASAQVVTGDKIQVVKTADDPEIDAGQTAASTIEVSTFTHPVDAVTLTDTLPAGISWSEDSAFCSIAGTLADL